MNKSSFFSRRNVLVGAVAVAFLATGIALGTTFGGGDHSSTASFGFEGQNGIPATLTANTSSSPAPVDFTKAAEQAVNGVVHVKIKGTERQEINSFQNPFGDDPFFDFFFGQPRGRQQRPQPQERPITGSGSGVIISTDGYIVTNNHVVDKADEIEVTLNDNRTFTATLVGKDPNTDIALIKVDAKDLTIIPFGNSDNLKVGEWVLAIGNPFNLTSTVTAGIVSAKARSINILDAEMKIEAFIQTDAAVNPGNSGGALVNTRGELVGINTAIASQTGSFSGYSFAVPVSIVAKVVADLKQYGEVQRAVLGVSIADFTDELAKEKKIKLIEGIYVSSVADNSAAKIAGIKEGDVITAVDNVKVKSAAELQEQIGRHAPGDKVNVTFVRENKEQKISVELKNRQGNTSVVKSAGLDLLGASLEDLSDAKKSNLHISSGVEVVQVTSNGKFAKAGVQKGFVIQKINNRPVKQVTDVEVALKAANSGSENALFISGIYPNGKAAYYAINLQE